MPSSALFVKILTRTFPQRFIIARMTRWPWIGKALDRWLFEGDDLFFLTRDKLIPINKSIDPGPQICLPSQVVEHFIQQANYHFLMNKCICRDGSKCKDYPIELGCLFLGETAMQINPALGRKASKEEALEHARKCREVGLVHLIGKNKLDTVWLGIGPGEKLLTICNCCPCCCLWKVLPYLASEIAEKLTRLPGVSVSVNDQCTGCGACAENVCFAHAIKMIDQRAVITDLCKGCGRCIEVCDQQAIEISFADDQFLQNAIQRIAKAVDVR